MTKNTNRFGQTTFSPVVPTYLPPVIIDQFVDDSDELQFILANGNTIPANRYNSVWKPAKTAIQWAAKGSNPDRTRIER